MPSAASAAACAGGGGTQLGESKRKGEIPVPLKKFQNFLYPGTASHCLFWILKTDMVTTFLPPSHRNLAFGGYTLDVGGQSWTSSSLR